MQAFVFMSQPNISPFLEADARYLPQGDHFTIDMT